jgi:hypothetical protein
MDHMHVNVKDMSGHARGAGAQCSTCATTTPRVDQRLLVCCGKNWPVPLLCTPAHLLLPSKCTSPGTHSAYGEGYHLLGWRADGVWTLRVSVICPHSASTKGKGEGGRRKERESIRGRTGMGAETQLVPQAWACTAVILCASGQEGEEKFMGLTRYTNARLSAASNYAI